MNINLLETIAVFFPLFGGVLAYAVLIERRLTKIETTLSILLRVTPGCQLPSEENTP
jgi:hypothetical protein